MLARDIDVYTMISMIDEEGLSNVFSGLFTLVQRLISVFGCREQEPPGVNFLGARADMVGKGD